MTVREMFWFGVRCVLRSNEPQAYEERVTIWRASSFPEAIQRAEKEAKEYGDDVGMEYVGLTQAYKTTIDDIQDGVEVFSLIRDSDLPANEYIGRFFATGSERQGQVDGGG